MKDLLKKDQLNRKIKLDEGEKGRTFFAEGLGQVTVVTYNGGRFFRRDKRLSKEEDYRREIQFAHQMIERRHEFLYSPVDFSCELQKGLCGESYSFSYYYPVAFPALRNEIKNRTAKAQKWHTIEVAVIYHQILLALQFLAERKAFHGDIRPSKIIFNPKTLEAKLVDSLDELHDLESVKNAQKAHIRLHEPTYLSPASFICQWKGKIPEKFSLIDEDLNALGLVVLELLNPTLQTMYGKATVNESELQNMIKAFLGTISSWDPTYHNCFKAVFDYSALKQPKAIVDIAPKFNYTTQKANSFNKVTPGNGTFRTSQSGPQQPSSASALLSGVERSNS